MNTIKHVFYLSLLILSYNTYAMDLGFPKNHLHANDYKEQKNALKQKHIQQFQDFNTLVLVQALEINSDIERLNFLAEAYSPETLQQLKAEQAKDLQDLKKKFPYQKS